MRGIDPNGLVSALVQDDPAQARSAAASLGTGMVYVPVTVILELEWILRSRYNFSSTVIADAIDKLAHLENAIVGEQQAEVIAARRVRLGWEFADVLHHALSSGCEEFVTFDRSLARSAKRDAAAPEVLAL